MTKRKKVKKEKIFPKILIVQSQHVWGGAHPSNSHLGGRGWRGQGGDLPGTVVQKHGRVWCVTLGEKVNCQQTFPTPDSSGLASCTFNKAAAATARRLINTGKLTSEELLN